MSQTTKNIVFLIGAVLIAGAAIFLSLHRSAPDPITTTTTDTAP